MTDPRDANDIRDSFLLTLRGEHEALDQRVVTAPRAPYYVLGTAISIELEGAEAEAFASRQEAFPDTASEAGVLKHAYFLGIDRTPASHATLRASIVGTPSSTLTVPADKTLTDDQGLVYLATAGSVATDGAGLGYITVTARDAGADQNLLAGEVLTWQNGAPTGMAATATTAPAPGDPSHVLIVGAAEESIEDLRERVRVAFKEPPRAQGTRADFAANTEDVEGVGRAFVYPRAQCVDGGGSTWTWTYGSPGCIVVMPLAAAPSDDSYVQNDDGTLGLGLRPATTRIPTSTLITHVEGYIEGTTDRSGRAVPESAQVQLRPAGMVLGNYVVRAAKIVGVTFIVRLTVDPGVASWPWGITDGSNRAVTASSTTTATLDDVTGIAQGSRIALFLGLSVVKGGWWLTTVQSVVGLVVTVTSTMPAAPAVGAQYARPDCGLWSEVRRIILREMNRLGPGDVDTGATLAGQSLRFPRPNDAGADRIALSNIIGWLDGIPGVTAVGLDAPVGTIIPDPGVLAVAGEIRVMRA